MRWLLADADPFRLPVWALPPLPPAGWPEDVPPDEELEAVPALSPVEDELPSLEPADPPPAVPLDDEPLWDCDPEEPELPDDLGGGVTFGGVTDGTVTVGVETVGTLTCGTVTVGTVTVGPSAGDALLVSGSTASGTMNPSAAASPAATHRNRPRRGDECRVPVLRPAPLRRLTLPGIVLRIMTPTSRECLGAFADRRPPQRRVR